ncbi:hypothetical protein PVL29_009323 [Vitis rotundifolia]|nr:hypothetical protein PVL29_009323 [Vitis rotundifolia]
MPAVPKVMRVVHYGCRNGEAHGLKHVEVPVPAPAKDEVLLKVEAASLNPLDWKLQKMTWGSSFMLQFPHIPGIDVAGEVVEVGARVKEFKAGEKVVSVLSHVWGGGLAEFAVAKENLTVSRPSQVSAAEGAGLPISGLTALRALIEEVDIKLDGSGKQKSILIEGASGGVGHHAVQLAKLGNTHVTATCGTQNIDFVRSLGADEVLPYKTQTLIWSLSGRKYNAVLHCSTGIPQSIANLSTNREVIDLTPVVSTKWTRDVRTFFRKKQLVPKFVSLKKKNLAYLVGLKEGKLKTVIDSKHPLSKAEAAWTKRIDEDGDASGKIIVEP